MTIREEETTTTTKTTGDGNTEIPMAGDVLAAGVQPEQPPTTTTPSSGPIATYKNHSIRQYAIGCAMGHLGAFSVWFFGIKGPNGEWPYAYWALLFLFAAVHQYFNIMQYMPSEVKLDTHTTSSTTTSGADAHGGTGTFKAFEFYNVYGKLLCMTPFNFIANMEYTRRCCIKCVCITFTEEAYQRSRTAAGICGCCVRHKVYYPLCEEDAQRMIADFERYNNNNSNVATTTRLLLLLLND